MTLNNCKMAGGLNSLFLKHCKNKPIFCNLHYIFIILMQTFISYVLYAFRDNVCLYESLKIDRYIVNDLAVNTFEILVPIKWMSQCVNTYGGGGVGQIILVVGNLCMPRPKYRGYISVESLIFMCIAFLLLNFCSH